MRSNEGPVGAHGPKSVRVQINTPMGMVECPVGAHGGKSLGVQMNTPMGQEKPSAHPCGQRLACTVLSLGLLSLLYAVSSGGHSVSGAACPPCDPAPCSDDRPRRQLNQTCCACPPTSERWEMHEDKYYMYPPPTGTRTLRLYYTLRPGEAAVDEIYGTAEHPVWFPPAYQAFPYPYVNGVQLDYRLGDVGGVTSAFDGLNLNPQLGYPTYDSWLTLGDDGGGYMPSMYYTDIDFGAWTIDHELLAPAGRVGFALNAALPPSDSLQPVLIAQISYNASDRGPDGQATAWLAGPTDGGGRWSYAARWRWAIDSPSGS
jgi:hypothetical protein